MSRSRPGSPSIEAGGTTASTLGRPCTSGSAPPNSPDTTSTPSSARSPPRRWTAPGPSPASCTTASSASPYPTCGTTRPGPSAPPPPPPPLAHELAAALDDRTRAVGECQAASPEPWLARQLGVLAPGASPALRAEYARRAGTAAAYREAAEITNPQQAVAPGPHRSSPELEDMRQATIRALEIRDQADILRGMTQGELEACALDAERAQASAPPDVSGQLRLTAQVEADAWQQAADAQTRHDHTQAAGVETLASLLAAERQHLEAATARYEQRSAATTRTRETAAKARAELARRGLARPPAQPQQPEPEPPDMARWWQQFEADLAAVDRAVGREYQAAITAGTPWPPHRTPPARARTAEQPPNRQEA